jgi:hypothetical protein
MEDLQKAQDDSMHQFYRETQNEPRNWRIISQLNYDIRENVKLLNDGNVYRIWVSVNDDHQEFESKGKSNSGMQK